MAEPVSLILNFLREHNFEKAEEALRLELQSKHSFTRSEYSHVNAELASFSGDYTAEDHLHRKGQSVVDKTTCQELKVMLEPNSPDRIQGVEMQRNQMQTYTEWEFKACSNEDCVMEFKRKDARRRIPLPEVASINNHVVSQNGMEPTNGVHNEKRKGARTAHKCKNVELTGNSSDNTLNGLASAHAQQCFELGGNHLSPETDQPQQNLQDAYDLKDCIFVHEPREVLEKPTYGVKVLYSEDVIQNVASSAYNRFLDTSWLDHGVHDADTLKLSEFPQPSMYPLLNGQSLNWQEKKQVVHRCIDYFKALASESDSYPANLIKDLSLPWETPLQNCLVEGKESCKRQTQLQHNSSASSLMPPMGNLSIRGEASDGYDLEKLHTNVLFEPSFSLGSFLDVPVGQEIASPGVKHTDGACQFSYSQNVMQETPELLSGFATIGDELTDPGIGYSKEYWGSDRYEDNDDPGYERQEIEDEDWFIAHEIMYANEEEKALIIQPKVGEVILSQINEESDPMGKEDSFFIAGEHLLNGGRDVTETSVGSSISSITALMGHSSANGSLTLNQIANMSYDGNLMDTEELRLMRADSVWQDASFEVHLDKEGVDEAHDKPFPEYSIENDSRTDTLPKKVTTSRGDSTEKNNSRTMLDVNVFENVEDAHTDSYDDSSDIECPTPGITLSLQERQAEFLSPEDGSKLWIKECHGRFPVQTLEHETSLNSRSFPHIENLDHVSASHEAIKLSDGGNKSCTYESSVDELLVEDEETRTTEETAQLEKPEEYDYEIFSLRIIHRKNRTGFEDEKHFQVVLNSVIAGRYLITEYLGSAAFSKAVQARDLQTGMDVCMKIIKNNKDFFDQSLDEIKLLKYVNKNDPSDKHHLLRLYDYFYHREHLFIVCEHLRANLYEFQKFNRESGGEPYFTMCRLQFITQQCLEALEFLHGLGLIHCDLKPENILIKSYSRCEVKVIDLGSSCFQTDHLCSYVQSRSYRAPEVILGLPYDQKIDIWSLGCILAELCSGNVLFQNDSLATLLARVVGIIEPIMPDMILKGKEAHKYFTKNSMLFERNEETKKLEYLIPKKSSLHHRLPLGDQGFVDFVGYLLQVNPENRPSASEALRHPWLTHPYEPFC